jgi:ankyrin repeat protein
MKSSNSDREFNMRRLIQALSIILALLPVAAPAAGADGRQLVDASKAQDAPTVRALVKQGIDVNATQADGTTALHWSAHWDDLDTTTLLIRAGAKLNVADANGVTPLLLACANGNAAMVDLLLEAGANPRIARATGVTPLMLAARSGNVRAVKALLGTGADVNSKETTHQQTALMWAVAENHVDVVRVLLENGADVKVRTPARQTRVSQSGQFAGGECCLPNYVGGFTALLFAAQQGHKEAAGLLLTAGADINDTSADGSSTLVLAVDSAPIVSERVTRGAIAAHDVQRAMAQFLLDKGADPNRGDSGRTALHAAVQRKMPELVKMLLAKGANPNARLARRMPSVSRDVGIQNGMDVNTIGATPFWLAASYGDVQTMRILLAGGADPTLTTNDKTTPLMVATGIDFVDGQDKYGVRTFDEDISHLVLRAAEAAKLCLDLGLDVNATSDKGQTALFGAVYMGSPPLVQLLVDHGAHIDVTNKRGQTPWLVAAKGEYRAGSFFIKKEAGDLLDRLGANKTLGVDLGKESLVPPRRQ